MVTFVLEKNQVSVPAWVTDLDAFRRWAEAEDFPEKGRVCYLMGEVWVDMSTEQIFSHSQVKAKYAIRVGGLVENDELGLYFVDGPLLSNSLAELSVKPDGMFISNEALETGRVKLIEGVQAGFVEVEGSPDMTLEIVSDSSVYKDTELLMDGYWKAGVQEYWLVDARFDPLKFDIFKRTSRGYAATRKQGGWVKSAVLGKAFRLTQAKSKLGHPEFTLAMRDI